MSNEINAVGVLPAPTTTPFSNAVTPPVVAPKPTARGGQPDVGHPSTPAPTPEPKESKEPNVQFDTEVLLKTLGEAMQLLNEQSEKNARGLNFSIDKELNRHVITVRNTFTGEVVRQIPTDVMLKVAHSIHDMKGLLLDQQG